MTRKGKGDFKVTGAGWIKRAVAAAMFGVLDGAAFSGEAYRHFKRRLFERSSPGEPAFDDMADSFLLCLGVLFLLGYSVSVLFFFGFQK